MTFFSFDLAFKQLSERSQGAESNCISSQREISNNLS